MALQGLAGRSRLTVRPQRVDQNVDRHPLAGAGSQRPKQRPLRRLETNQPVPVHHLDRAQDTHLHRRRR